MKKPDQIMEELRKKGFSMTTKEFFRTFVYVVLEQHGIKTELDIEEYFDVLKLILEECLINDIKESGIEYWNGDEWMGK